MGRQPRQRRPATTDRARFEGYTRVLFRWSSDRPQWAPARIVEFVSSPQGMALSQAFAKMSDRTVRRILVSLVERIASAIVDEESFAVICHIHDSSSVAA